MSNEELGRKINWDVVQEALVEAAGHEATIAATITRQLEQLDPDWDEPEEGGEPEHPDIISEIADRREKEQRFRLELAKIQQYRENDGDV